MVAAAAAGADVRGTSTQMVIAGASAGTVFEWYDFYLYGSLAGFVSEHFFSSVNATTGYIFALLAFAAGFVPASGSLATRSAKWPGLLTFTGLIGDWPCLALTMKSVCSQRPLLFRALIMLLRAVSVCSRPNSRTLVGVPAPSR